MAFHWAGPCFLSSSDTFPASHHAELSARGQLKRRTQTGLRFYSLYLHNQFPHVTKSLHRWCGIYLTPPVDRRDTFH